MEIKGADVVAITDPIKYPKLFDYELERLPQTLAWHPDAVLHPQFNEENDRTSIKRTKRIKKKRKGITRGDQVCCDLKPIKMVAVDELRKHHPDFNERLTALQKELETVVNLYIENAPFFRNKVGEVSGYIASNLGKPQFQRWTYQKK